MRTSPQRASGAPVALGQASGRWVLLATVLGSGMAMLDATVVTIALPAIGADLGGNATAIGASANVVVLGIAERNRQPISFWQFTKYGLVVTVVTVALSAGYVWLRYFALA